MIHRDLSDGNIMIMDNGRFRGFLLDLDYAFNWMEVLELAGEEVSEEAWTAFVEKYNQQVSHIARPALPEDIPVLFKTRGGQPQASSSRADSRTSWTQRMKMKERTVSTSHSGMCALGLTLHLHSARCFSRLIRCSLHIKPMTSVMISSQLSGFCCAWCCATRCRSTIMAATCLVINGIATSSVPPPRGIVPCSSYVSGRNVCRGR